MMRAISKQCGKRQHDNDLLIIQDRIGETRKVFQNFDRIFVNIPRFIPEGYDNYE